MKKSLNVFHPGAVGRRKCGPCSACCSALAIPDLEKPEFTRCVHVRKGSRARFGACSIYADRPGNCRDWDCGWIRGMGEPRHRPDKSGIVLDVEESTQIGGFVVKVWEIRKGATEKPDNRALIEGLCEHHPKPVVALAFLPGPQPGPGRRRFLGGNPQGCKAAAPVLDAMKAQAEKRGSDFDMEID